MVELDFKRLIAKRSVDADDFLQMLLKPLAEMVIPPSKNRKERQDYHKPWYKKRHQAESFVNKIKYYRRIFSRFEKLAKRYLGLLSFVGRLI